MMSSKLQIESSVNSTSRASGTGWATPSASRRRTLESERNCRSAHSRAVDRDLTDVGEVEAPELAGPGYEAALRAVDGRERSGLLVGAHFVHRRYVGTAPGGTSYTATTFLARPG